MSHRTENTIEEVRKVFETETRLLSDEEYLEVCDELASDFEMRAQAKRDELERDDDA